MHIESTIILASIVAWLHFLTAFGVVATVLVERILFNKTLSINRANFIRRVDGLYGLSALLVLVIGFLRVFYFEKGSEYYFANPMFHLKLTLFVAVGLLSIYPTVRFMKWKKLYAGVDKISLEDKEYSRIKTILNIELGFLILLMLAASLMAKGVFY